jgi:MHS family alpha-ketoglutarate permease-like MFS transporter
MPSSASAADTAAPDARRVRRLVAGAAIGNWVEWFDWYVYAAMALYFAPVFFPKGDATAQLLNAAAVFAVGFLMRPLGGWLLGLYADRHGRKSALTLSIGMMSIGSLMIALTPGYAQIGVAAPALLVLARLVQGLSVGGEYGATATYISEVATPARRGFFASFQGVTGILGQLTAMAVLVLLQQVLMTRAQLEAWGWRIPFVVGAGAAIVALVLRRRLEETPSFLRAQEARAARPGAHGPAAASAQTPPGAPPTAAAREEYGWRALRHYPREVAIVVGLTLGGIVSFYTYTTYAQKFLVNTAGLSREAASAVSAATLFVFVLIQPVMGALSDRIGRRPLLFGFSLVGSLITVPLMTALSTARDPWAAAALILLALLVISGYTSINGVVKAELFPTRVRAVGVGLPYALTVSIFGGSTEYLALRLKDAGHESMFYWYVSGCLLVSLCAVMLMTDTRDRDLDA